MDEELLATGNVLRAILLVSALTLLAYLVADRLQAKLVALTGFEYVFLGALLAHFGLLGDLDLLLPFVALAAGWFGLLRGMELDLRRLAASTKGVARVVLLHHVVPGVAVGAAFYSLLTYPWSGTGPLGPITALPEAQAQIIAAVLGCCAAADSAAPMDLLARRYELGGSLVAFLRQSARLGDSLVILFFGLLICWYRDNEPGTTEQLGSAAWILVALVLGCGLGLFFRFFLAGDQSPNGRFLALAGIITFASGAAYSLKLSPLLVNLALGVTLANVTRRSGPIRQTLESTERPMVLLLFVLAGALWRPTPLVPTLVALALFVGLRLVGKLVGSLLAGLGTPLRADLFRGLMGQGEVTVAMAVSFRLVYDGPAVELAYSVIIASVILHDLVAPRLLRGLLVDAGALNRELARPASG